MNETTSPTLVAKMVVERYCDIYERNFQTTGFYYSDAELQSSLMAVERNGNRVVSIERF